MRQLLMVNVTSRPLFIRPFITLVILLLMFMFHLYAAMNNALENRFALRYRAIRLDSGLSLNRYHIVIRVSFISGSKCLYASFCFYCQFSDSYNNCQLQCLTFTCNYHNVNCFILNHEATGRPGPSTYRCNRTCNGGGSLFLLRVIVALGILFLCYLRYCLVSLMRLRRLYVRGDRMLELWRLLLYLWRVIFFNRGLRNVFRSNVGLLTSRFMTNLYTIRFLCNYHVSLLNTINIRPRSFSNFVRYFLFIRRDRLANLVLGFNFFCNAFNLSIIGS